MREEDWAALLEGKKFDFRNDKLLFERISMSVHLGLNDLQKEARSKAW